MLALKEITIESSASFTSPSGAVTESRVSMKIVVDEIDPDAFRETLLRQKWELDYLLLEMEYARGTLTSSKFDEMRGTLERNYISLLED